ncbi:MAG: leucyl aminopeptidase [Acidimicrobiia bacterium]|nr:leucyl aminopeptidase [Acidimicrobiia bacterium]
MPSLAVGIFEDGSPGPLGDSIDVGWLGGAIDSVGFEGKHGKTVTLPGSGDWTRVYVVGLGQELTTEGLREAMGELGRLAEGEVTTSLQQLNLEDATRAVIEGFQLGSYRFDRYKTGDDRPEEPVLTLHGDHDAEGKAAAEKVTDAVIWARRLVDTPAADKAPSEVVEAVRGLPGSLEIDVYEPDRLTDRGFGGVLGVAAGASREPRLLDINYTPSDPVASIVLVGKGIIFDSGGLSLKPANLMEHMKNDMAGAAAVLAATSAIADLGIPVAVRTITPLVENMTGGAATRPGDVLTSFGGKTIEVLNTDAEGRLVLADGIGLANEGEYDLMIDVATLTGAMRVGLGNHYAGVFSNRPEVRDRVLTAADCVGERMWPMPMDWGLRKDLDSEVADICNHASTRYGGAIHAALFLEEFVGDRPWAHIDIAGPSWSEEKRGYQGKGGTGFGVRTLVEVARTFVS